jgi:hypothetical protein
LDLEYGDLLADLERVIFFPSVELTEIWKVECLFKFVGDCVNVLWVGVNVPNFCGGICRCQVFDLEEERRAVGCNRHECSLLVEGCLIDAGDDVSEESDLVGFYGLLERVAVDLDVFGLEPVDECWITFEMVDFEVAIEKDAGVETVRMCFGWYFKVSEKLIFDGRDVLILA